jgi:hypothetical protein
VGAEFLVRWGWLLLLTSSSSAGSKARQTTVATRTLGRDGDGKERLEGRGQETHDDSASRLEPDQ